VRDRDETKQEMVRKRCREGREYKEFYIGQMGLGTRDRGELGVA